MNNDNQAAMVQKLRNNCLETWAAENKSYFSRVNWTRNLK